MYLKRLLPILIFVLALPAIGFAQDKGGKANDKAQKKQTEVIKSVPITNKNIQMIRQQNKKATMEQMHMINKAVRKSMTVHRRK
jgi:hypothetical protein